MHYSFIDDFSLYYYTNRIPRFRLPLHLKYYTLYIIFKGKIKKKIVAYLRNLTISIQFHVLEACHRERSEAISIYYQFEFNPLSVY